MGRQVAKEIGATYYETSVVTMWGVHHVFESAIRTALITRRQTRFWSSHLKGVQRPQLQPPYLPEKADPPNVSVPSSSYKENLKGLLDSGMCADVEFLVDGQTIKAHRAILCAAAPTFAELFSLKEVKISSSFGPPEKLVFQDASVFGNPGSLPEVLWLWIPITASGSVKHTTLPFKLSGNIPLEACTEELEEAARNLQLVSLVDYVANIVNNTEYMNTEVHSRMVREMTSCAKKLVNSQMFSDIVFQIEGRIVMAHKAFLVAQCEMMEAMFMTGHFKESGVQVVEFKDTSCDAFLKVLEYLYTGQCPSLCVDDIIDVMALANFFCLTRLVALCEQLIIKELQVAMATNEMAVAEDIIGYLLEAQIHNATQLEAWCIHFIATHYNAICRQCPKHIKNLDSLTLKSIEKKRWPPPWYILEADWFEKATRELDNEKAAEKLRKSSKHIRHKRKCSCL
ncbi:Rho- BTB domain-containing protein 1 [Desmophyllum pertusum]|uniref:Rho- BTB domain-containing protein 1 n=1 Tax=Desmophyllum pertusum TaxID=174260 RepID=A0A9X0A6A2_9CNID|nr:Rho- BTB domain-containing protein 1 [Desmophyllum pertusum]